METGDKNGVTGTYGVQFDEKRARSHHTTPVVSKMIKIVVKLSGGLIKNERQANFVLLGVIGVCILIMFWTLRGVGEEVLPYDGGSNPEFQMKQ